MVRVEDPEGADFVANKLDESFDLSQYYANQSHFDAVCGTSGVRPFPSTYCTTAHMFRR